MTAGGTLARLVVWEGTMRRFALVAAVLAGVVLATTQSSTQPRADNRLRVEQVDGREAVAGEVLVKLRGPSPARDLGDITRLADADTVSVRWAARACGACGRDRVTRAALVRLLANHPAVAYAEPNYIVRTFADPPDPLAPQLWGLQNVGQAVNNGLAGQPGADIHAAQAWDVSVGSTAHVVAVIDTGIDYTHPDLVGNLWSAPAPFSVTVGGVSITCPGRLARLQRHRPHLRSDGRPQPRHARRRHHRRRRPATASAWSA